MKIYAFFVIASLTLFGCQKEGYKPDCLFSLEEKLITMYNDGFYFEKQIQISSHLLNNDIFYILPPNNSPWLHSFQAVINSNCDTLGFIPAGSSVNTLNNDHSNLEYRLIEIVWQYP